MCLGIDPNSHTSIYKLVKVVNGSRWRTDKASYSSFHTPGTSFGGQNPPKSNDIKLSASIFIYVYIYTFIPSL